MKRLSLMGLSLNLGWYPIQAIEADTLLCLQRETL